MKVLSKVGVQDIMRHDIPATLDYISELTEIPRQNLVLLGSAGKSPVSGDIDIAIDERVYSAGEIHTKLLHSLGEDCCTFNPGTLVGSYAFPIKGEPHRGKVQVDLMYVRNIEWAKFAYFSAGTNSAYKGAIRAILLSAIAGTIENPGDDVFVYDEEGELLVRVGWGLYLPVGLKRMYQMRGISQKTGKWLKTMKNTSPNMILKKFPELYFHPYEIVIDDPKVVTKMLFDKDTHPCDIETVEDILWLINETSIFTPERAKRIMEVAKKRAAQVKEKMEIPSELQ